MSQAHPIQPDQPARPKRRWFQYRLRTLLLLTAVIAAIVALLAVIRERTLSQEHVIRAIESKGGRVWFEQVGPDALGYVVPKRYRRRVRGVTFANATTGIDQGTLRKLTEFPNLTLLDFDNASLEVLDLTELSKLSHLRELFLNGTKASRVVEQLKDLKSLEVLHLGELDVTDDELAHLAHLPQLRELYLCESQVTGTGLHHLVALKNLRVLDLYRCQLEVDALKALSELTQLEELYLDSAQGINDSVIPLMCSLPHLRILNIVDTNVSARGVGEISHCANLEDLAVDAHVVTSQSLAAFQRSSRLHKFHICNRRLPFDGGPELTWISFPEDPQKNDLQVLKSDHSAIRQQLIDLSIAIPVVQIDCDFLPPKERRCGPGQRLLNVPPSADDVDDEASTGTSKSRMHLSLTMDALLVARAAKCGVAVFET